MSTVSWTWIVAGLLLLLAAGLAVAMAIGEPACPSCGGRIHTKWCPWRSL